MSITRNGWKPLFRRKWPDLKKIQEKRERARADFPDKKMDQRGGEAFYSGFYKKFYDIWVKTSSEMLDELMRSPEFAAAMGKYLENSLDFKKHLDELIESSLKRLHLPTSSDITSLSGQIGALERRIQGFSQKLDEIGATIADRPPSRQRPSPQKKR